jgi:hypothetical protein
MKIPFTIGTFKRRHKISEEIKMFMKKFNKKRKSKSNHKDSDKNLPWKISSRREYLHNITYLPIIKLERKIFDTSDK